MGESVTRVDSKFTLEARRRHRKALLVSSGSLFSLLIYIAIHPRLYRRSPAADFFRRALFLPRARVKLSRRSFSPAMLPRVQEYLSDAKGKSILGNLLENEKYGKLRGKLRQLRGHAQCCGIKKENSPGKFVEGTGHEFGLLASRCGPGKLFLFFEYCRK